MRAFFVVFKLVCSAGAPRAELNFQRGISFASRAALVAMSCLEAHTVRRATTDLNCFCFAALISTLSCVYAQGASMSFSWDPSPTPNLTGYVVYYGLAS